MIIVGQRVATIADADKIIVLEHGEIVGCGTHDELLETARPTSRSSTPSSAQRRRQREREWADRTA